MNKNDMNGTFCHVVFTAKMDAMQNKRIQIKNRKTRSTKIRIAFL